MERYLSKTIDEFSKKKFIILSGPRQVGKTTLAKTWLQNESQYLNWDIPHHRTTLLSKQFVKDIQPGRWVLDEIHKYSRWKSLIKGLFDARHNQINVIVTGSARLDSYQRGGDSMLGRYERLRLHPLTIGELTHGQIVPPPENWLEISSTPDPTLWRKLRDFSGFPEPFFEGDILTYTRWSNRRRDLLIREDIRDLSAIRSIDLVEQMAMILPERVGSSFSLNNVREDLQVAHDTAKSWFHMLEKLYFCYILHPLATKAGRSLRKEPKVYLWDWASIPEEAARFENMVANHLLKAAETWTDIGYGEFKLQYWRDRSKREVDFVMTKNRKPIVLIECKLNETALSPNLAYCESMFKQKIPQVQLVAKPGIDIKAGNSRVVTAWDFLGALI